MCNERFMFWFWESPTRSRHACKDKKHLHCLIIAFNLTLLAQRLNNLFEDSFFQIKFFVMLNCGDWSPLHLIWPVKPDKAVFVNSVTGKLVFYPPKESELAFSFRPTRKDQQVCGSMLMFHIVNTKLLGICLKNDSFQWFRNDSESTLSFKRQYLYTRCTFRFNTVQDVFIRLELLHTAWNIISKNT